MDGRRRNYIIGGNMYTKSEFEGINIYVPLSDLLTRVDFYSDAGIKHAFRLMREQTHGEDRDCIEAVITALVKYRER